MSTQAVVTPNRIRYASKDKTRVSIWLLTGEYFPFARRQTLDNSEQSFFEGRLKCGEPVKIVWPDSSVLDFK